MKVRCGCGIRRGLQGGFDPSKTDFDWPEITHFCSLELKLRMCGFVLLSKYAIWEDRPYFISRRELYLTQVFFFSSFFFYALSGSFSFLTPVSKSPNIVYSNAFMPNRMICILLNLIFEPLPSLSALSDPHSNLLISLSLSLYLVPFETQRLFLLFQLFTT